MKYCFSIFFLLLFCLYSCVETTVLEDVKTSMSSDPTEDTIEALVVPDTTIDMSTLEYDNSTSLWTMQSQFYSGYALKYYPGGVLEERTGFLDGRKQNQSTLWFPDQHLKRITNYHKGKLHGVKKSWSPEEGHILISQLNYHRGKAHGEQKLWYKTGELYKVLNLNRGGEDGIQRAYRKNGDLYANYEAKEGRIFGLKKAALCYGLEEESIQYEE